MDAKANVPQEQNLHSAQFTSYNSKSQGCGTAARTGGSEMANALKQYLAVTSPLSTESKGLLKSHTF